jgi:hypothetical protein
MMFFIESGGNLETNSLKIVSIFVVPCYVIAMLLLCAQF